MSTYNTRQMIDPAFNTQDRKAGSGFFRRMVRSGFRQWQRRKMIAVLNALDDNVLTDIGIHRGEILRVVGEFSDRELAMNTMANAKADEQHATTEPGYLRAA